MEEPKGSRYFRKGLGHRRNVAPLLHTDYHSGLVEFFKHGGFRFREGDTELRLAREFGFCYGVDRAVEYAYECRDRFPDRRIWITGEIIHNPWVNRRLEEMGIRFLDPPGGGADRLAAVRPEDVVLIPAFGMENEEFRRLRDEGVLLVDTTCGSVLSVWKSVERYAADGFTAVVHGKMDKEETGRVCEFLEGRFGAAELRSRLAGSYSEGFDPDADLQRIGLANQTTMLSSESLEIAEMLRRAMARRHGEAELASRFRSFDTICSATQDRQDAVKALLAERCDLMIVIGGFNSSNTSHLLEICRPVTRAYHIEDVHCLLSPVWIRHQPLGWNGPVVEDGWLPDGPLVIGVTAGASTPDREVGASIARILALRGVAEETIRELADSGNRAAAEAKERKGQGPVIPVLNDRRG
jgi:4-hydroxy-3-methylbut-2-enyl diphosphate reductase